ncbi:MAG: sugar phosphate isomerase/epimerase, partial [Clostridia bacterium]|nr:sugar phosphate isomerase/epimerase [Clostridia bacterium]
NFKVCLDTGHCAVCGVKAGDAVRETGKEYLAVLHVHDNNGRGDFHWLPYFGVIDWRDFTAALKEIGYDGSLSLETNVPGGVPEAAREPMELALAKMAAVLAGNLQE